MKRLVALALGALAAQAAAAQQPEQWSFGVADSIGYAGTTTRLAEPLPLLQVAGIAYRRPMMFTRPTRLRFRITRQSNAAFSLRISSEADGRTQWRYDGDQTSNGFLWTSELNGPSRLRVELSRSDAGLQLELDRRVESTVAVHPQTLFARMLRWIREEDAPTQEWGRSIVLLTLADDSGPYPCTGWLIAPRTVLTNFHCVPSDEVRASARVTMYDDGSGRATMAGLSRWWPHANPDLDYAIAFLDVDGPVPLPIASARAAAGVPLVLIGHPEGKPKRVSRVGCSVAEEAVAGAKGDPLDKTDFSHRCDTIGGSSGSPVLAAGGQVLGLHHLGVQRRKRMFANRAVHIDRILADIKDHDDPLYQLILGNP